MKVGRMKMWGLFLSVILALCSVVNAVESDSKTEVHGVIVSSGGEKLTKSELSNIGFEMPSVWYSGPAIVWNTWDGKTKMGSKWNGTFDSILFMYPYVDTLINGYYIDNSIPQISCTDPAYSSIQNFQLGRITVDFVFPGPGIYKVESVWPFSTDLIYYEHNYTVPDFILDGISSICRTPTGNVKIVYPLIPLYDTAFTKGVKGLVKIDSIDSFGVIRELTDNSGAHYFNIEMVVSPTKYEKLIGYKKTTAQFGAYSGGSLGRGFAYTNIRDVVACP